MLGLRLTRLAARSYSTAQPRTTTIQLVADLRKATNAPIVKARQALTESGNDFQAALQWLERDLASSGAEKAAKFKDRTAREGLISISLGDGTAAIAEVNCETDFVARTEQFARTASDIARTAAAQSSSERFNLLDVPQFLSSSSTATVITDLVARTGENVNLRRVAAVSGRSSDTSLTRLASYVHNSIPQFPLQGRIGSLALVSYRSARVHQLFNQENFRSDAEKLERALARQIVGFNPDSVNSLYDQQFMMIGGERGKLSVRQVMSIWIQEWSLDEVAVDEFVKWEVGESL